MINVNMNQFGSGVPTGTIAHPQRSAHRTPALAALTARPRSRGERREVATVPSATIRRPSDGLAARTEDRFPSSNGETTPGQHDEFAVTCSNSVTTGSGEERWTRWSP